MMDNDDNAKGTAPPVMPTEANRQKVLQRKKEIHQRIEQLNEERHLKDLLSDEWDD